MVGRWRETSLSPEPKAAPSPRPSPHRMGRGGKAVRRGLLAAAVSCQNAREFHSLSPSEGERAGVRGFLGVLTAPMRGGWGGALPLGLPKTSGMFQWH